MAAGTSTPILPLYVHGLAEIMPKGSYAPLPGGVVVEAGDLLPSGADIESIRNRLDDSLRDLASRAPDWGNAKQRSRRRN